MGETHLVDRSSEGRYGVVVKVGVWGTPRGILLSTCITLHSTFDVLIAWLQPLETIGRFQIELVARFTRLGVCGVLLASAPVCEV